MYKVIKKTNVYDVSLRLSKAKKNLIMTIRLRTFQIKNMFLYPNIICVIMTFTLGIQ